MLGKNARSHQLKRTKPLHPQLLAHSGQTIHKMDDDNYDECIRTGVALTSSVAESHEDEGFEKEGWLKYSVDPREE